MRKPATIKLSFCEGFMRVPLLAVLTLFLLPPASADAEKDCNAYSGWEALAALAPSRIIMFGELHGTNESPDAVRGLLCELVNSRTPIKFGLEAAHNQGPAIDRALSWPIEDEYLISAAPEMWSVADGRSSVAVLNLLNDLAEWRAEGAEVAVFAFDSTFEGEDRGIPRSTVMSREVDLATRGFEGAVVLLTGGGHIILNPPERLHEGGSLANEAKERPVLAMEMLHEGGKAFVTASFGGGETTVGALSFQKNHSETGDARIFQLSDDDPRMGWFFVGPITASPPAFPDQIKD